MNELAPIDPREGDDGEGQYDDNEPEAVGDSHCPRCGAPRRSCCDLCRAVCLECHWRELCDAGPSSR